MTNPQTPARARLATRLAFFAAGFAVACWAPLIPFAKANVGADEAGLGLLLLCFGLGSVVAMPVTGWLAARSGAKPMIMLGGVGLALVLPLLPLAGTWPLLAAALFVFGGLMGTLDVAMNVHAAELEHREGRPLMSGFHAQFSVGTFAGSGFTTGLLSLGLAPAPAALTGAVLTLAAMLAAQPRLMRRAKGEPAPFALPRGVVLLLAALAAIVFLTEGAVLDWGALLMIERGLSGTEGAGLGFMFFSIAMVVGRLSGDRVVAALGGFRVLVGGGLITILGIVTVLIAPIQPLAMTGFALIGLGASNLVPVVFSAAGRQTVMPAGMAIAAVTTVGYAGVLLGPAAIGFAADLTNLSLAFGLLAVLMAALPLAARTVARV